MTKSKTESKPSAKERSDDLMRMVTERIIEQIETGAAGSWEMPWQKLNLTARNAVTGRHYTGGNRFVCAGEEMFGGKTGPWATFKQWQSLSTQEAPVCVRKGEKATYILVPKVVKKEDKNGDERRVVFFGVAAIFAASQVDGYVPPVIDALNEDERIEHAERWTRAIIANGEVKFHEQGDGAFFSPRTDEVYVPPFAHFKTAEHWYSTTWHELTHWTGPRLGRDVKVERWGDDKYAGEELVAELGAAFACALHGIDQGPRDDHAAYLASWLRVLRADPARLWQAASMADKALEHLDRLSLGAAESADDIIEEEAVEMAVAA